MNFDPTDYLNQLSRLDDTDIDLAYAALALAFDSHDGISLGRYLHHLDQLVKDCLDRYDQLLAAGAEDTPETQLAALKFSLSETHLYRGDAETYDAFDNADLYRVIDRRCGLPIALCILYIRTGRHCGWALDGLNFPGHFLARITHNGGSLIFDPFQGCQILQAFDLRQLLKTTRGEDAELSTVYYEPAPNREILLRLLNNIKIRQIRLEYYEDALEIVSRMQKMAPADPRLLFDSAILNMRCDRPVIAIRLLERYEEEVTDYAEKQQARSLLVWLKQQIQ